MAITHPTDALFLRLWSKAAGTESYDKAEWIELQRFVEAVLYGDAHEVERIAEPRREIDVRVERLEGAMVTLLGGLANGTDVGSYTGWLAGQVRAEFFPEEDDDG
jgi:hypothetical protein